MRTRRCIVVLVVVCGLLERQQVLASHVEDQIARGYLRREGSASTRGKVVESLKPVDNTIALRRDQLLDANPHFKGNISVGRLGKTSALLQVGDEEEDDDDVPELEHPDDTLDEDAEPAVEENGLDHVMTDHQDAKLSVEEGGLDHLLTKMASGGDRAAETRDRVAAQRAEDEQLFGNEIERIHHEEVQDGSAIVDQNKAFEEMDLQDDVDAKIHVHWMQDLDSRSKAALEEEMSRSVDRQLQDLTDTHTRTDTALLDKVAQSEVTSAAEDTLNGVQRLAERGAEEKASRDELNTLNEQTHSDARDNMALVASYYGVSPKARASDKKSKKGSKPAKSKPGKKKR